MFGVICLGISPSFPFGPSFAFCVHLLSFAFIPCHFLPFLFLSFHVHWFPFLSFPSLSFHFRLLSHSCPFMSIHVLPLQLLPSSFLSFSFLFIPFLVLSWNGNGKHWKWNNRVESNWSYMNASRNQSGVTTEVTTSGLIRLKSWSPDPSERKWKEIKGNPSIMAQ